MLTNNGKALLYCCDYEPNYGYYSTYSQSSYKGFNKVNPPDIDWEPKYTLQRTNGIAETLYKHTGDNGIEEKLSYTYLASNLEVVVGSDDTPATVQDYNLGNEIISTNLKELFKSSRNKQNSNVSFVENPIILHATKQYYNVSLIDNIVIKEIGLITKDGYGYSYLLLREVLDNPIVLGPDETISLTILMDGEEFTPNGRVFCYLTGYDNGKNSMGTSDKVTRQMDGVYADGEMLVGPGYDSTKASCSFHQAAKNIYLERTLTYGSLQSLFKDSYNYNYDNVSYVNPIIIHATETLKASHDNTKISKLHLRVAPGRMLSDSSGQIGFINDTQDTFGDLYIHTFEEPIVLNEGDTITFTITVK